MKKKTDLKAVRQNKTKSTGKTPTKKTQKTAKKATKPVKKTAKRTAAPKTTKKTTSSRPVKKTTGKKTNKPVKKTTSTAPKKIQTAEKLRQKNDMDMAQLDKIQKEWEKKYNAAKTAAERREIDAYYEKKFKRQEDKEKKSYSAYYNHVEKNFTKEQRKAAFKSSGDFMSKKYTNGLLKAVRDEKNR